MLPPSPRPPTESALTLREALLLRRWLSPMAAPEWRDAVHSVRGARLQVRKTVAGLELRVVRGRDELAGLLSDGVPFESRSPGAAEAVGWVEGAARAYFVARVDGLEHRFPVPFRRRRDQAEASYPTPVAQPLAFKGRGPP